MELKTSPNYIKEISGRSVTGIFSIFGNVDSGDDRIWPGAFRNTFEQRKDRILFLYGHDTFNFPTAKITALREITREELPIAVLEKAPMALGGAEVTREYLDTPRGNEALACVKSGAINEMSFSYDAVKFDFEEKSPDGGMGAGKIRNLREVRVYEASDVPFGMNDATVASKAFPMLGSIISYLQALKAGARHNGADATLVNQIAECAYLLGATNVQMMDMVAMQDPNANGKNRRLQAELVSPAIVGSGKDRRAEPVSPAPDFAAMRRQLMELDLALFN